MVEILKYQGEEYPVKFGYYAIKMLQSSNKGKTIADLQEDYSLYESFLFYAMKKGHELEKIKFELKKADMENILEDTLFDQVVPMIGRSFDASVKVQEAGGKKSTLMSSQESP